MPNVEPHRLPATELARLVETGRLSAERAVASCIERIAEREPVVASMKHSWWLRQPIRRSHR